MHHPGTSPQINEEEIFQHAAGLVPTERPAYLSAACVSNPEVRIRIERLLQLHEDGEFMGTPADRTVSASFESEFRHLKPEEVGERIGNYKLLEQIGEGGFGVVWVAEQEKPMRRRVALKIIKLGMDTKAVIARFEQERQALAMMDHPNIAKVLEAGMTPLGRPFFVMELVRGIKITEYCDQAHLPTEERLRLFIAVCHAVQHAHQKGIIHRDLKPSNILVTLHDGVPVPKVIDFGVAKATQQQRLTDLTVYTQFEQMIGTPLYMSPEQAEMSGLDIDTRSDIYSLGVLLYELLTGRTPFDPEELMKAGFDEMRRVIREQEPQKPSTFLSTMAVDLRTNSARHRQTESGKWIGQIRGDLDWIVMQALEKDRTRRYETANGLAKDIERHLLSEPVQARPASQLYRFRRFAKRNKVVFGAGSAVFGALVIGLTVSTWMFFKEKQAREAQIQERKRAETEANKSRQVAQFLTDMLDGVGPSVALGRDTKMLREILDKTAERVGTDLKDQPDVEADLRSVIGKVYATLGEYEKSSAMLRNALALRRTRLGNEHPDVADLLCTLAEVLNGERKRDAAEIMHRQALAMRRKLLGHEHPRVAYSLMCLAMVLRAQGNLNEAEMVAREAVAMTRKLRGNEHELVSSSLFVLAQALGHQGKVAESESIHREVLAMRRKMRGDVYPTVAESLLNLAQAVRGQNKLAESEALNREALAIARKLYGQEHPALADLLQNLGIVLEKLERLSEAETVYREALAMQRKLLGDEHLEVAKLLNKLATILRMQGKLADAETMQRDALAMFQKVMGDENLWVAASLNDLAVVLQAQGRLADAETTLREALAMSRKYQGNEHEGVAVCLRNLAAVLQKQRKWAEAEPLLREALRIQRKLLGDEHREVATSLSNLAGVLGEEGKLAEAENMHREALAMQRKRLGNEHPEVAVAVRGVAFILQLEGKLSESETLHREALAISRKWAGNDPKVGTSLNALVHVLELQNKWTEAEVLLREALAILRRSASNDMPKLEGGISLLAENLYRQSKYAEAEAHYRELLESRRGRLAADAEAVVVAAASLARLLSDWAWAERSHANLTPVRFNDGSVAEPGKASAPHERAHEAERLLRDSLAIRLRGTEAAHWRADDLRSRLGGAVLAVAVTEPNLGSEARLSKFAEAESLLLEGNEGLKRITRPGDKKYQRDALIRLVRLYEALDKTDKVADWQQKLAEFDKAEAKKTEPQEKGVSAQP